MFPTFESITHEQPRLVALLGAALFVLGIFVWMHTPAKEPAPSTAPAEEQTEEQLSEKERVLNDLAKGAESIPEAEKEQLLESLKR